MKMVFWAHLFLVSSKGSFSDHPIEIRMTFLYVRQREGSEAASCHVSGQVGDGAHETFVASPIEFVQPFIWHQRPLVWGGATSQHRLCKNGRNNQAQWKMESQTGSWKTMLVRTDLVCKYAIDCVTELCYAMSLQSSLPGITWTSVNEVTESHRIELKIKAYLFKLIRFLLDKFVVLFRTVYRLRWDSTPFVRIVSTPWTNRGRFRLLPHEYHQW